MGCINKKDNSWRSATCARMGFICLVDVSIGWRWRIAGDFLSARYTAVFGIANTLPASKKTQSGGVVSFKLWRLEVVGDRLVRAVWGMTPNDG